jgi:hypothetical protein
MKFKQHRAVEMFAIEIPLETVRRMSNEERYSYYLLGHMFNELMFLQKLAGFSLNGHNDERTARKNPEMAQALTVFRIATSKIWEAQIALNSKEVSQTLRSKVFPKLENGSVRLKNLNKAISDASWLNPVRNGLGFHFPRYTDWADYVQPNENWVDDVVIIGRHSGNTHYESSEAVAQHWFFDQFGSANTRDAVEPMIDEMIKLMGMMNSFLEDSISTIIAEELLTPSARPKQLGKVLSPRFDEFNIPFWTFMPDAK